ncbi:MAG: asparaginyl/glutamyl-tRNA amidotransferase subunit C [Elusimicrobia bacterium GWA2_56_46]|nr:MAG: asparaginyl/glutamyl-tRNA amidotransferase subunit C [Elusimicrobia bacterium GWA2_56_46]OGR53980.1 MAG: asparaginyl/glutamyl-tRNA amidotransferase subunit C [Elusimicrobia bacterium GWC2_56_31]HBB65784.1 Asp-tRNA(Asn)/Glu-tRNA(Gln) amidotransferase subunit GatB [Elusimicrobiota bacterium]HBW22089.1 Asp-tRNA(Asn)/Glu-tRNA(Gln) amidotransferase subunit GatB [Elusimicrobiota bacterium]
MEITEKDVEHIAELARLELAAEEKKLYTGQLKSIFGWMEELNKADTASVPPTSNVLGAANPLREDKPFYFEDREAILKNAPGREYDFIKVKKVIE